MPKVTETEAERAADLLQDAEMTLAQVAHSSHLPEAVIRAIDHERAKLRAVGYILRGDAFAAALSAPPAEDRPVCSECGRISCTGPAAARALSPFQTTVEYPDGAASLETLRAATQACQDARAAAAQRLVELAVRLKRPATELLDMIAEPVRDQGTAAGSSAG